MPFLFDCREAWENAISDPSYHPDMHFPKFMELYKAYRDQAFRGTRSLHTTKSILRKPAPVKVSQPTHNPGSEATSQLLSQREIDSLISQMNQGSTSRSVDPPKESQPKADLSFSGLMSQDDIDALISGTKNVKPAEDFGLLSQDDLDALMGGR